MLTQSTKEDLYNRWAPIIGSMGLTGSKADWMTEYTNNQDQNLGNTLVGTQSESFPSLLPISVQVAAQTIGLNLVAVKPMGGNSEEELERIAAEIKAENRDAKIDAVIDDKEYVEKKIQDHPEYGKGGPSGKLFYMDYKYGDSDDTKGKKEKPHQNIMPVGKKKRRKR